MKSKGFTLIELMVVIVILMIPATLFLKVYDNSNQKDVAAPCGSSETM
jgi:prepilin-type N-terminal cleavage/methylation domain-containing protein